MVEQKQVKRKKNAGGRPPKYVSVPDKGDKTIIKGHVYLNDLCVDLLLDEEISKEKSTIKIMGRIPSIKVFILFDLIQKEIFNYKGIFNQKYNGREAMDERKMIFVKITKLVQNNIIESTEFIDFIAVLSQVDENGNNIKSSRCP